MSSYVIAGKIPFSGIQTQNSVQDASEINSDNTSTVLRTKSTWQWVLESCQMRVRPTVRTAGRGHHSHLQAALWRDAADGEFPGNEDCSDRPDSLLEVPHQTGHALCACGVLLNASAAGTQRWWFQMEALPTTHIYELRRSLTTAKRRKFRQCWPLGWDNQLSQIFTEWAT